MLNPLEKSMIRNLFVPIFWILISYSSVFSQNRSHVTLHRLNNLHDSTLSSEILMKDFISINFQAVKNQVNSDLDKIVMSEKDWEKLSDNTKNRLAQTFQVQRFLYFSDKEIEIFNWHFDFIINKYNYFVSSHYYEQVLNELSDDKK
jgi:hypothetical protein